MAKQVKPVVKFIVILVVMFLIFGLIVFAKKNTTIISKIIPEGKRSSTSLSEDVKEAEKDGTPVVRIGVVTFGGYAGGQYFNGGFKASKDSRYYKEKGILVEFVVIDDFKASRDAWKSDKIDMLWGTADSFPTEVEGLSEFNPKIVMQSDWSRKADAIVVKRGIKNVKQLRDCKIAVALGTPSHSLLLNTFETGSIPYNKDMIKPTDSAIAAAQLFKTGEVDAAVVWSPDDADCLKNVPGSSVLVSTEKGGYIIADVFFVKEEYLNKNREIIKKVIEGWLEGAAEINNDPSAKDKAVKILADGLNIDNALSEIAINNVRLATIGDNKNFFGCNSSYTGVKGEDLYLKMNKLYSKINLCSKVIPMWRNITDKSIIEDIPITSKTDEAEGVVKFAKASEEELQKESFADKEISVNFDFGSSVLSDENKYIIDEEFGDISRQFQQARVRIEGNTDNIGSYETNKRLSFARANSVAKYLIDKYGFDKRRFIIIGNGPDKPVDGCEDNNTNECRAKNRRTEFSLLN